MSTYLLTKISCIASTYWGQGSRDGAVVRALAFHQSVSRVRFPFPASYVCWVCCWFSSFLREVFLRVLRFSPPLKNQHSKFQFGLELPSTLSWAFGSGDWLCLTLNLHLLYFLYKEGIGVGVTHPGLTSVGWPDGEEIALPANLIWTKVSAIHRKWTQVHAKPGQTDSKGDPTCLYLQLRLGLRALRVSCGEI